MEKIAIDRTLHPQVKMGARELLAERRSEKKRLKGSGKIRKG